MTRFARARGSKASNERREEEATPWHVMRQQLADQLNCSNENVVSSNTGTTEELKSLINRDTNSNAEEVWCDYGIPQLNNAKREQNESKSEVKLLYRTNLKCKKVKIFTPATFKSLQRGSIFSTEEGWSNFDSSKPNTVKKEKNKCKSEEKEFIIKAKVKNCNKVERTVIGNNNNEIESLCKIKNKKNEQQTKQKNKERFYRNLINEKNEMQQKNVMSGSGERNIKKAKFNEGQLSLNESKLTDENNLSLTKKKKLALSNTDIDVATQSSTSTKIGHLKKQRTNNNFFRTFNENKTIVANGREIKVVKYEAFWVKEDDSARLKALRKKLKAENIPNEKIKAAMKLERRRAEKALAREKTNVCFNCRKFGHKLSECPEIKDSELSKSGICFKCGSLEHSHFECKVQHDQGFRHAVCFVCKEQGHIARQCPLNSQGQYPKGGSCHVCGEVTHMKRDCPKLAVEGKPETSKTVEKWQNNFIEDISVGKVNKNKSKHKKNKVIVF